MHILQALRSSVQTAFPDCRVLGCYFHFTQVIWTENIKHDIQSPSLSFSEFGRLAFPGRMLALPAFLPSTLSYGITKFK